MTQIAIRKHFDLYVYSLFVLHKTIQLGAVASLGSEAKPMFYRSKNVRHASIPFLANRLVRNTLCLSFSLLRKARQMVPNTSFTFRQKQFSFESTNSLTRALHTVNGKTAFTLNYVVKKLTLCGVASNIHASAHFAYSRSCRQTINLN